MANFLDELARLNQQNFLGGLVVAGQAQDLKNQNEKLTKITADYQSAKAGIDNDLKTTSQSIEELNKASIESGNPVGDQMTQIQNKAAKMQSFLFSTLEKQKKISELYSNSSMQMAGLTIPEAQQQLKQMGLDYEIGNKNIEQLKQIPMEVLQYNKANMDIAVAGLDWKTKDFSLKEAMNDVEARNIYGQSIGSEQYGLTNTVNYWNIETGKINPYYQEKANNLFEAMDVKYKDNPNALAKAKALVKENLERNIRKQDPYHAPIRQSSFNFGAIGDLQKRNEMILSNYAYLKKLTLLKAATIYGTNDPYFQDLMNKQGLTPEQQAEFKSIGGTAQSARDLYTQALNNVPMTKEERLLYSNVFSDKRVIEAMPDGAEKTLAKQYYTHYIDKDNDMVYGKVLSETLRMTGYEKVMKDRKQEDILNADNISYVNEYGQQIVLPLADVMGYAHKNDRIEAVITKYRNEKNKRQGSVQNTSSYSIPKEK